MSSGPPSRTAFAATTTVALVEQIASAAGDPRKDDCRKSATVMAANVVRVRLLGPRSIAWAWVGALLALAAAGCQWVAGLTSFDLGPQADAAALDGSLQDAAPVDANASAETSADGTAPDDAPPDAILDASDATGPTDGSPQDGGEAAPGDSSTPETAPSCPGGTTVYTSVTVTVVPVPAGCGHASVVVSGAGGGSDADGGPGGAGASVDAVIPLYGASTLFVYVAGAGRPGCTSCTQAPGGFGGAQGGYSMAAALEIAGGGGGGSSEIAIGCPSTPLPPADTCAKRLVVAGGGGGSASCGGGGAAGQTGANGASCGELEGGSGATQTMGGAGGVPLGGGGTGTQQSGGTASGTGGGGGGGYYSGGGGGMNQSFGGGGGGGGSSWIDPGGTGVYMPGGTGDGEVGITWAE